MLIYVTLLVKVDRVVSKKLPITVSQYKDRLEYQRQWRKLNPDYDKKNRNHEKVRENAWRRRYGITREDYEQMLKSQEGACAICRTNKVGRNHTYFHVDHDHETGKIRGLLCDLCNRGLGYFKDDFKILYSATIYLKNHSSDIHES